MQSVWKQVIHTYERRVQDLNQRRGIRLARVIDRVPENDTLGEMVESWLVLVSDEYPELIDFAEEISAEEYANRLLRANLG